MRKTYSFLLALSIFFSGFAQGVAQTVAEVPVSYGNNLQAGRYYNIRGFKMYVEEYGEGMPVLLIHGNGSSIDAFKKTIPGFEKNYRVIATDSRAHGKSTDEGDSLSFEMMADDQAALLDSMNIDSAYVIGYSDGGIIALELAIRHPDKVIKLASTGADICPDSTAKAIVASYWIKEKKYYDENKNKIFTNQEEKNHWKVKMLDWFQPNIPLSAMQSIRCPALIIGGDRDIIKIEHTVQIYQSIPHAFLWIVPDSGHATLREHADDFNRLVEGFFHSDSKR